MDGPKTPPKNREREYENLRVPAEPGEPPRAATEPPGSEWSVQTDKTLTDPVSGEPHEEQIRRKRAKRAPGVRQSSASSRRNRP